LVDWGLAARIGTTLAGSDEDGGLDSALVADVAEAALDSALAYTWMVPAHPVPGAEVVGRREWIEVNLAELRDLAEPLEQRASAELSLPGPLEGIARRAMGAAAAAEAGALVGYASRRVIGQYVLSLGRSPREPRMILVGSNVTEAAAKLEVDPAGFLRWVAIHEQTHSIQFGSVPWLRDHLASLIARMIESTAGGIDLGALLGRTRELLVADPRTVIARVMRGELTRVLAGEEQRALFDEIQAVMAVIEGHAEHVMDAAAADDPTLATMRSRMDERRAQRGGLADMIARALGLGAKLRQYELGKRWADGVVGEAGIEGLNRVWQSPAELPSLSELEAPGTWLDRVAGPAPTH
jgi:coenzyme F420 biosynthesis associated uncharacterized protein